MSTKASPTKAAPNHGGDGRPAAEMRLEIEGTPSFVDAEALERALRGVGGVLDVRVEPEGGVRVHYVPGEV